MTYNDALFSTSSSANRNAAKRGSMGGYLWKFTDAKNGLAALTDEGDYRIALVKRDGDQYIFTWDESAGAFTYNGKVAAASGGALDNTTVPTVSNTLTLDAELHLHIGVGQDWTIGAQADFESSRTGTGEW